MNVDMFLKNRGVSLDNCLKASDFPSDVKGFSVTLGKIRPAPEAWNSPLIAEFTPNFQSMLPDRGEINQIALNKTNIKYLIKHLGADSEFWTGKEIRLERVSYPPTDTRKEEWVGIEVSIPERKAAKR